MATNNQLTRIGGMSRPLLKFIGGGSVDSYAIFSTSAPTTKPIC